MIWILVRKRKQTKLLTLVTVKTHATQVNNKWDSKKWEEKPRQVEPRLEEFDLFPVKLIPICKGHVLIYPLVSYQLIYGENFP